MEEFAKACRRFNQEIKIAEVAKTSGRLLVRPEILASSAAELFDRGDFTAGARHESAQNPEIHRVTEEFD